MIISQMPHEDFSCLHLSGQFTSTSLSHAAERTNFIQITYHLPNMLE